jgi:hypothetical protein
MTFRNKKFNFSNDYYVCKDIRWHLNEKKKWIKTNRLIAFEKVIEDQYESYVMVIDFFKDDNKKILKDMIFFESMTVHKTKFGYDEIILRSSDIYDEFFRLKVKVEDMFPITREEFKLLKENTPKSLTPKGITNYLKKLNLYNVLIQ